MDGWRAALLVAGLWSFLSVYPLLGGDGIEYFVLLRSPLFDGDLSLANDFAAFGYRAVTTADGEMTSRVQIDREINEFEAHQASSGMVIRKFWLHVSKEEQLRRFKDRERDPFRSHKLTPEHWRNRARWGEYEAAVEEMLARTSTRHAPWTVVEADDKYHARVKVLKTLADGLARGLK